MRRRDYEMLSTHLRTAYEEMQRQMGHDNTPEMVGYRYAMEDLAGTLARDNGAFDKARFLKDIGVEQE